MNTKETKKLDYEELLAMFLTITMVGAFTPNIIGTLLLFAGYAGGLIITIEELRT